MTQTVRFVDTVSYTEADQADFNMRMMRPQGVIPESIMGTLIGSAIGSMAVRVGAGEAFVQGFQYMNDANVDLTISGNSSGSTRVDVVVLRLNRVSNSLILAVLQGIAGAGAPALTQVSGGNWEFPLYNIQVANGAVSIVAGNIVDVRVMSRWAASTIDAVIATDAEITTAVNAEATTRANADTTLTNNLNTEVTNRTNADTNLQTNINNEASTRSTNDSTEVTNRTNADNALNTRITTLEGYTHTRIAAYIDGATAGVLFGYGVSSCSRVGPGRWNLSTIGMPHAYVVLTGIAHSIGNVITAAYINNNLISVTVFYTATGVLADDLWYLTVQW